MAPAVPIAPPTTPAATSPGQKPESWRSHRLSFPLSCQAIVPVSMAVPGTAVVPIGNPALIIAGIGISRSHVLAIGVRIELRAIAGIVDHLLRHDRVCQRGGKHHGSRPRSPNFVICFLRWC